MTFSDDYSTSWLDAAMSDVCETIEDRRLDDEQIADLVANLAAELRARERNMPASRDAALAEVCRTVESWGVNGLQMADLVTGIIPAIAARRDEEAPSGIYFESDAFPLEGRA